MILTQKMTLSETQKSVINHEHGHLRIVACPGSGKTEVVSRRTAELIKNGVDPKSIIAFTFTKKAAEELKMRIRKTLEEKCPNKSDFGDMYIGTIDSYCLYVIKQLKPEYRSFEVLDSARRTAFVDRWYYHMGFQSMENETRKKWKTIKMFCESVDRMLIEGVDTTRTPDDFAECYENYKEKLKKERFFDFISIIHSLLELLRHDANALGLLNDSVKHVVFDEYQDVNKIQEELLEFLSRGADSVCVVGDDDQNIFQWRGSNIKHIIEFPKKYRQYGVTTKKLDVNYRATDGLIDVANQLIRHNDLRVEKNMKVFEKQNRRFETGDIVHHHFDTDEEEFDYILQTIRNLKCTDFTDKHGQTYALSYQDMAVIVRTNEDAARIISFFERHDIPAAADSGSSVFARPVVSLVTDCICYVFRCPGYTTGEEIPELETLAQSYREILDSDPENFCKNLEKIRIRADSITGSGRSGWLPNLGLQEFFQRILCAMGSEEGLFNEVHLYHLAVLSKAISDYEYVYQTLRHGEVSGLKWFIMQFAESNYSDPRYNDPTAVNAVRILTIWKAKGLEFPVVFVPTFVDRRKPPKISCFVDDSLYERTRYDGGVEDDRRAYYTAITRSQKYLFLTGASQRNIAVNGSPSKREIWPHPFIDEMRNHRVSGLRHIRKAKSKNKPLNKSKGAFPTSYSELSNYERCPYDYRLRHMLGFNPGAPVALGYGTNMHNILNQIHTDFIQKKKIPTTEEIDKIFDRMFYLRFAQGSQNEKLKKAGSRVIKNYVNLHANDFEQILETEKRFEFVMDKALISGHIDLLKRLNENGEVSAVEIIDFKTDKQKEDGLYELDYSEQVRFYSYASVRSLEYKPVKATVHHLDTHDKDIVDISDKALKKTAGRIKAKVENIVSGNFDAAPDSKKCAGCDFRALCQHKGFKVGVDFKPVRSARRAKSMRRDDDGDFEPAIPEGTALGPSIASANMMRRAEEIASRPLARNGDGSLRIPSSSNPNMTYNVTESRCQCKGFRNYPMRHPGTHPTCSHIEAVKIFNRKN